MSPINAFTISLIVSVAGYAYLKINALTAKFEELVDKVNDGDLREKESKKVILGLEDSLQLLDRDFKHLRESAKSRYETRHDMTNLESSYFDNVLDKQATVLDEHAKQISSNLAETSSLRAIQDLQSRLTLSLNEDVKRCVQDYKDHQQMQELIRSQQSRLHENLSKKIGELIKGYVI